MNPVGVFVRMERKALIGWAVGLALLLLMLGGVYASFDDPDELSQLMENYPEDLADAFGIEDIGSVKGFLSAELGAYMPLIVGIYAIMYMTKHLAGAEERGTLDHVLARPMTRAEYYWGLFSAGAIVLAAMLLAAAVGGILGFALAGASARDLIGIVGLMIDFLPVGIIYLSLGGFLGTMFHRRAVANSIGIAVVITMFAVDIVARLVEELDWFSYLTPHGYLARSDLFDGQPDIGYLVFAAIASAVFATAGLLYFEKKDLYA